MGDSRRINNESNWTELSWRGKAIRINSHVNAIFDQFVLSNGEQGIAIGIAVLVNAPLALAAMAMFPLLLIIQVLTFPAGYLFGGLTVVGFLRARANSPARHKATSEEATEPSDEELGANVSPETVSTGVETSVTSPGPDDTELRSVWSESEPTLTSPVSGDLSTLVSRIHPQSGRGQGLGL